MEQLNLYQFLANSFVILVSGKDSARYLQARLTNDIRKLDKLDSNHSILAAALDSNGKTQGVFSVSLDKDSGVYTLVADGGDKQEVLSGLLRFKVADRLEAVLAEEFAVAYQAAPENSQYSLSSIERFKELTLGIELKTIFETEKNNCLTPFPSSYIIYPINKQEELKKAMSFSGRILSDEEALALRIKNKRPIFDREISPKRIYIESQLFSSLSNTKGCYAGQEVIERASSRGKSPKVIVSVSIIEGAALAKGDPVILVSDASKIIGEVLSFAWDIMNHRAVMFILIQTDYLESEMQVLDGRTLQRI